MAQHVWTLSVDLQTKTATFQTGMADAAKAARGSFEDIKRGAHEMGGAVGYSTTEARHGVMLLGEEFGIHLPRGITSFISSLGPVGAAMEAAFPFLAIIVGATLLIEHLAKVHEAAEKAANAQGELGTTISKSLLELDDKLLEAGIRVDDLNSNHLAALRKQLQLIDNQSLEHLMSTFDIFAKSADKALSELKTSWYQFGAGSKGAQNALDDFKRKYDSLLAQGKDKEAHDFLAGTAASARKVLELQEQAKTNQSAGVSDPSHGAEHYKAYEEAKNALKQQGIGFTEKEVTAQQELVAALGAQVTSEQKIAELKHLQDKAANIQADKSIGADSDKLAKEQAQAAKAAADEAEKAFQERYRVAVSALEESEKEKIAATQQGSEERLAVIDAAIKAEESKGLQETGFYKGLLTERANITRQLEEEQRRVSAELKREDAENDIRIGLLGVAADEEQAQHKQAMQRVTDSERLQDALRFENEKYAIHKKGFADEITALDTSGKDYELKLKQIQDHEAELTKEHENKITQIKDRAEQERNQRILSADRAFHSEIARGMTQTIMGQQRFGAMMTSIGNSIAAGMIQNALMSILADDMTKERDAAHAARKGFIWGMDHGGVAAPVLAPVLAAAAFASVMAFESGGIVPGVERGDVVNARLTPGEGVIPRALMEGLTNAAKTGDMGGGKVMEIHRHTHNHNWHAVDGASVDRMLQNHGEKFEKHVEGHLRKMNR